MKKWKAPFCLLLCLLITGCSTWILQSGKHRDILKVGTKRTEIIAVLGKPIETEKRKYDMVDLYQVQGKLPSNESVIAGHGQGVMLSFGIAELIAFPITVAMLPGQMTSIHDLHIYYDESGNYITHEVRKSKKRNT